jgi:hypothetical protein
MPSIPIVGKCFTTPAEFLAYLEGLTFGAWRPKFITMHHTGAPSLATWQGWQTRSKPVSDEQWLRNLAAYYGGLGWSAGPHFFVMPKHICVLSDPTKRGVHAVSFNALSWGVEVVGDFDSERLSGAYLDFVADAMAAMHIAAGLQPAPYRFRECGLHFHRDDPKTSKTCPGRSVAKDAVIDAIEYAMVEMTGRGEDPDEPPRPGGEVPPIPFGIVDSPDSLNVRQAASGKAAVLAQLEPGTRVRVLAKVMNGTTEWLQVHVDLRPEIAGFVASRYVAIGAGT